MPKRNDTAISNPKMILEYNKFMGSVGKCDQYLSYYYIDRKAIKWWKKVFFSIFEIYINNSMVIYFSNF